MVAEAPRCVWASEGCETSRVARYVASEAWDVNLRGRGLGEGRPDAVGERGCRGGLQGAA